jgi:hypothetical protein
VDHLLQVDDRAESIKVALHHSLSTRRLGDLTCLGEDADQEALAYTSQVEKRVSLEFYIRTDLSRDFAHQQI